MNKKQQIYLIGITLVATLGGLLFGYDTAVISGTVDSLKLYYVTPLGLGESATNALHGTVVSSAIIGCIIGGALAGVISEYFGRKRGLIIAAALFLVSAIGSAWPEILFDAPGAWGHEGIWVFVFYRIVGGVGVGLASMLSPMYIAEIAPSNIRGKLVSLNQFAIIFGMLVVYFVNYSIGSTGDSEWLNTVGWRWMFASECVPALLFLGFLFTVPESPRWLILKNKDKKGIAVLNKLFSQERSSEIFSEIKESGKSSGGKLLTYGLAVIVIGVLLSVFQQFVGINVVLYYAPTIFKDMGSQTDASLLSTIYVGAINLIFTVLAIYTVDRFGRKRLMIIGAIAMGISMIALGFTFFSQLREVVVDGEVLIENGEVVNRFVSQSAAYSAFILILTYIAGFAMSWGPVTWVLLSEMYPNKIRSIALSIAVAAQWISNYVVSVTFPMMNKSSALSESFHHGFAYWIYGIMGILAALFVWKFVPETKGKTLEQMEAIWKKKN